MRKPDMTDEYDDVAYTLVGRYAFERIGYPENERTIQRVAYALRSIEARLLAEIALLERAVAAGREDHEATKDREEYRDHTHCVFCKALADLDASR